MELMILFFVINLMFIAKFFYVVGVVFSTILMNGNSMLLLEFILCIITESKTFSFHQSF